MIVGLVYFVPHRVKFGYNSCTVHITDCSSSRVEFLLPRGCFLRCTFALLVVSCFGVSFGIGVIVMAWEIRDPEGT